MFCVSLGQGISNGSSSLNNPQSSEEPQGRVKRTSLHPIPSADKQFEVLRENAIKSLMNNRGLSQEEAESQIKALS